MNKGQESNRTKDIFTPKVLKLAIQTYLACGVILTLAILKPFPLMEEANPFQHVDHDPEWYLLSAKKVLEVLPGLLSALVLLMIPLLFILLPFFEKRGLFSMMSTFWRIVLIMILTFLFAVLTWDLGC